MTLRWSADGYLATDYTVFVHLVDRRRRCGLAQGDAPPLGGRWPTSLWLPGMVLDDVHTIPLPRVYRREPMSFLWACTTR